jgi:hypothetical protein
MSCSTYKFFRFNIKKKKNGKNSIIRCKIRFLGTHLVNESFKANSVVRDIKYVETISTDTH